MDSTAQAFNPVFMPGTVAITPAAEELLQKEQMHPLIVLRRHVSGDWGEMDEHDRESNWKAAATRGYILSSFTLPATNSKIWLITEPGHTLTTILLPSDH